VLTFAAVTRDQTVFDALHYPEPSANQLPFFPKQVIICFHHLPLEQVEMEHSIPPVSINALLLHHKLPELHKGLFRPKCPPVALD
jgi:hypothetical protein